MLARGRVAGWWSGAGCSGSSGSLGAGETAARCPGHNHLESTFEQFFFQALDQDLNTFKKRSDANCP